MSGSRFRVPGLELKDYGLGSRHGGHAVRTICCVILSDIVVCPKVTVSQDRPPKYYQGFIVWGP